MCLETKTIDLKPNLYRRDNERLSLTLYALKCGVRRTLLCNSTEPTSFILCYFVHESFCLRDFSFSLSLWHVVLRPTSLQFLRISFVSEPKNPPQLLYTLFLFLRLTCDYLRLQPSAEQSQGQLKLTLVAQKLEPLLLSAGQQN